MTRYGIELSHSTHYSLKELMAMQVVVLHMALTLATNKFVAIQ